MTTYDTNFDGDIELEESMEMSTSALIQSLVTNPAVLALLEANLRRQSLRSARRVGNTQGKWAQKPVVKGASRQATQRIF